MSKIRKSDLPEIVKSQSMKLHNAIQANNFLAIQDTMNLICRTITFTDEFIDDEFINAILQEVYGEYGGDQLVASERGYPIDFKPLDKTKMKVKTACGSEIEIDSVMCNQPYSSEVFKQYYDYLTVNKQKTLPVTITQNDLRRISCGEGTFNKLRELILSKVAESIQAYIRDEVYCAINDPTNYKEIVELKYNCDNCEGTSFISELTKFALKLQINTQKYNLAGRIYDLPLKSKAWLLSSIDLSSRLASRYAQGGTNANYIDISQKFARVFDIPQLNIADGVIMDKNWLQIRKIFSELIWTYKPEFRNECGVYNLDLKFKPINFFTAVPFKLIEIDKKDFKAAEILGYKIEAINKEFVATTKDEAESKIKPEIEKLNTTTDPKLTLEYKFFDFVAPEAEKTGIIKVTVTIKNSNEQELTKANNQFILVKE